MKWSALFLALFVAQQIPHYSPEGIWESQSGSQYEMRLEGSDLHVKIVPGSNAKFLQYQVEMKTEGEINSYRGTGFFVAKMDSGKECKFDTEWRIVVVSTNRIIGVGTNIDADKDTCAIINKSQSQIDLKKK